MLPHFDTNKWVVRPNYMVVEPNYMVENPHFIQLVMKTVKPAAPYVGQMMDKCMRILCILIP